MLKSGYNWREEKVQEESKLEKSNITSTLPERDDNPPAPMDESEVAWSLTEIETADETKIPVSYQNAEEALLSMIVQDVDVATMVAQSGLLASHFQKIKNQYIFSAAMRVWQDNKVCNFDLVSDKLEKKVTKDGVNQLEAIGGLSEINRIVECTPQVIDIKVAQGYVDIVFERYRLNKIKDLARWFIGQRTFDEEKMVDKISDIQRVLTDSALNKYGLVGLDTLLADSYNRFKDRKANPEQYEGFDTGFVWLNKGKVVTKRRVCTVGAKTTRGKSIFVSQIVGNLIRNGVRTLVFTPELDKEEYIDRMLCSLANVPIDNWKAAHLLEETEFNRIVKKKDELMAYSDNLFIEDRGSQTCGFILSSVKKHMLNHGVDVVVVDYLQKIKYYGDNTKKAITDIMEKFCSFAKDNNVAFIVVSQLRRSADEEPRLYDLKESGDIENFSDSVILLHRDSVTAVEGRKHGWYKIEKNRQGLLTECVRLRFNDQTLKFTEVFTDEGDNSTGEGNGHSLAADSEQKLSFLISGEKENNGVQKGESV